MNPNARVVAALTASLTIGVAVAWSGNTLLLGFATAAETLGIIWINAIRMTVIPLVVSLLFLSLTGFPDVGSAGRAGARALTVFALLLVATAVFAIVTVPALFRWLPTGSSTMTISGQIPNVSGVREQAQQLPTVAQWLTDLVPTNPIRAAADGAMLPLLCFSVLFGLATTNIAPDLRRVLVQFFRAVSESMLMLVRWLIVLAPLGVFALILPLAARMGGSVLGTFGYYVIGISGLLCVQTFALYPIAVAIGRVPAKRFAQAVLPAQAVAFSSRSSLAALPALLEASEKRLRCAPEVTGFVLPFAVTVFKINTPIIWLAGACFVARLYAVPLVPAQIGIIIAASLLLSFSSPGIPMGGLILLAPVFASAGLPVEGVGILMAVDLVPDMFKTISNVTGDMTAAVILSRFAPGGLAIAPHGRP